MQARAMSHLEHVDPFAPAECAKPLEKQGPQHLRKTRHGNTEQERRVRFEGVRNSRSANRAHHKRARERAGACNRSEPLGIHSGDSLLLYPSTILSCPRPPGWHRVPHLSHILLSSRPGQAGVAELLVVVPAHLTPSGAALRPAPHDSPLPKAPERNAVRHVEPRHQCFHRAASHGIQAGKKRGHGYKGAMVRMVYKSPRACMPQLPHSEGSCIPTAEDLSWYTQEYRQRLQTRNLPRIQLNATQTRTRCRVEVGEYPT